MIPVRDRERACRFGHVAILNGGNESVETTFRWASALNSENPILIHAEASAAARAGRLSEAEALYREAIRICERLFDASHPHLAAVAHGLVQLYAKQGRNDEARSLCEEIARRTDRSRAVFANGRTLCLLADIYRWAGQVAEGRKLYCQALSHRREFYGSPHSKVVECLAGFAQFEQRAGHGKRAAALLQEAIAMLDNIDETASRTVSHAVREVRDLIAHAA